MKSKPETHTFLIYFILCLCILNLLGTGYFAMSKPAQNPNHKAPNLTQAPLPFGLNSQEKRIALFEKVLSHYNTNNYEQFYKIFDEIFKINYSINDFHQTLQDLQILTGKIKRGAYLSYKASEAKFGGTEYILHYVIETDKRKAILLILVFSEGSEPYRIRGFKIQPNN